MKQANNDVRIEGYLSEVDLEVKVDKENNTYIAGEVTIEVPQTISGKDDISEVVVRVWARETTKTGKENPAFKQAKELLDNGISLAACGGDHNTADKISVGGASLVENQFVSKDGRKVCYNYIRGSFFNKATKSFNPQATFSTEIVIKAIEREEKDDVDTGRLLIDGVIVQYNDNCDSVRFVAESPDAINFISTSWQEGDTVRLFGHIRYSVEESTVEAVEEVAFGETPTKVVKKSVKEFVITSGSHPYPSESAYDPEDIIKALKAKKDAFEAKNAETSAAPASSLRGF